MSNQIQPVIDSAHDPVGITGFIIVCTMSVLEFMNIYSGAIVALCAIGGLICTIIGLIRSRKKHRGPKNEH